MTNIVFATNIDEAEYIAKKVFDTSFVFIKRISSTANPQAFTANPQMFEI